MSHNEKSRETHLARNLQTPAVLTHELFHPLIRELIQNGNAKKKHNSEYRG
jgi:hypothetical protein